MAEPLAPRQKDVYHFILDHVERHECSPTVREIADGLGVASTNTIDYHLKALERKGSIRRRGTLARNIELLRRPERPGAGIVRLPIRGEIAAGLPIQALDDREEAFDVSSALVRGRDSYLLRVRGESMIEEHICHGDYVVVRPQQTARDGETVVALLADNGVTLKKFYRERGQVRLQPANATMEPLRSRDVRVLGRVVGLFRSVQ